MKVIDKYSRFNKDSEEKKQKYEYRVATKEEKEKVEELKRQLDEFLVKTHGTSLIHSFWDFDYISHIGYISTIDNTKETVVNFFGETTEDAFLDIISDYELKYYEIFEPIDKVRLALSDFEKVYGGNIPDKVLTYYKNYLLNNESDPKQKENVFTKIKKRIIK